MKKTVKRILVAALALVLVLGLFSAASAAAVHPDVLFDAEAKKFTISNASPFAGNGGLHDLFQSFKNLMPGDHVTETITVRVTNAGLNTVKLYLRAENPNEDYCDLFGGNSGATLDAQINGTAEPRLTKLGSLYSDLVGKEITYDYDEGTYHNEENVVYLSAFSGSADEKEITVTVDLPRELGNAYENEIAMIDWVFVAEIIPYTPPTPGPDKTPTLNKEDHYGYIIGYPVDYETGEATEDQTRMPVKPEANITRAEVATIFFRMLTDESRNEYWSTTNSFSDVPSYAWFNNAISTLANAGIINGYPDGSFGPNDKITRAEFATIAARFFEADPAAKSEFTDIAGHWAEKNIDNAAAAGLVNGYPDGTFLPNNNITRAEAMTIMNRVLGRNPVNTGLLPDMLVWPDNMDTSKWYYAQVQEATNSHDYKVESDGYETWTEMLEIRDWAKFEREWSDANSAKNPGEVISNKVP